MALVQLRGRRIYELIRQSFAQNTISTFSLHNFLNCEVNTNHVVCTCECEYENAKCACYQYGDRDAICSSGDLITRLATESDYFEESVMSIHETRYLEIQTCVKRFTTLWRKVSEYRIAHYWVIRHIPILPEIAQIIAMMSDHNPLVSVLDSDTTNVVSPIVSIRCGDDIPQGMYQLHGIRYDPFDMCNEAFVLLWKMTSDYQLEHWWLCVTCLRASLIDDVIKYIISLNQHTPLVHIHSSRPHPCYEAMTDVGCFEWNMVAATFDEDSMPLYSTKRTNIQPFDCGVIRR